MNASTMAGKLLITPGSALWFQPVEWMWVLGPLPPGVRPTGELAASTVAVMFVSNAASVRWFLDRHRTVLAIPPVVWICYPTRGRPDFNRATLVPMLAAHGQQPVAEVALDATWTAIRVRPFGAAPLRPATPRR
jgi:hypothetical protein